MSKRLLQISEENELQETNSETGQTSPISSTVKFAKDIEITDATKGIVLTSANGTGWRFTISNDGTLITTQI